MATSPRPGRSGETLFVRYFPGYTGHRPRLQHWHGTADTTLNYKNLAEDIKEWTNLLGLSETPTGTDTPKSGTTRQFWKNSCGYTVYETFSMSGVGHAVPFDGNAVAAYFGLDKAGGQDPETAACPGAFPGGGATAGSGWSERLGSSGGSTGAGDAGGSGGNGGSTDAGVSGSGGARAVGISGNGGASGAGGSVSTGAVIAQGGTGGTRAVIAEAGPAAKRAVAGSTAVGG